MASDLRMPQIPIVCRARVREGEARFDDLTNLWDVARRRRLSQERDGIHVDYHRLAERMPNGAHHHLRDVIAPPSCRPPRFAMWCRIIVRAQTTAKL